MTLLSGGFSRVGIGGYCPLPGEGGAGGFDAVDSRQDDVHDDDLGCMVRAQPVAFGEGDRVA
jgi:hypothetical protein